MSNPALYRYVDWIPGNILDASNMTLLQTELEKLGSQGLGQLYTQGTLLNAVFTISGTSIVFTHANSTYDVFAFINGQFEDLGSTVSIGPTMQPSSGAAVPLYLNWSWNIVTYTSDPTFVDGITGQPTIETGQLAISVDWADTSINGDNSFANPTNPSGIPLNPSTQFGKNLNPIVLAWFNMNSTPNVEVTYINGVSPYALGNTTQAGLVSLSADSGWLASVQIAKYQQIIDSNGNIQQMTIFPSLTGTTVPFWNVTLNGYTNDFAGGGTAVWQNLGKPIRGVAVSTTDPWVRNARYPLPNSVYSGSVAPLISSGFNSTTLSAWLPNTVYTVGNQIVDSNGNVETVIALDGTGTSGSSAPPWQTTIGLTTLDNTGVNQIAWINGGTASTVKYDPTTANQGGIFTDNIIYSTLKQKLTTFLDTVNTSIENVLVALSFHIGQPLGSSETHPFPTAYQVGAAPISHVGQSLNLTTSHPALVNSDTGGFIVDEITTTNSGDAFALYNSSSALKAGLTHSGDAYSLLANAANAQGLNGTGAAPANYTGTLGLMSLIANVLAEHVNYNQHGNNNPHDLDSADIGAASESYVNQQITDIISDVTAYTDARTSITTRVVTTPGAAVVNNNQPEQPTANTITYLILTINGSFEVAIGLGQYQTGNQVALPEVSGWNSNLWYGLPSMLYQAFTVYPGNSIHMTVSIDSNRIVNALTNVWGDLITPFNIGWVSVVALAYRTISAPPIIISSFDNTANTFNAGTVGDTVTIQGRNFGSTQSGSTVSFNNTPVTSYTSWSSTSLVVVIPSGATGNGVITIVVGANTVTSPFVFML